jgi:hypothetical protein
MIDLRIGWTLVIDWLRTWPRLIFYWPTHRILKLAPGLYLQVLRGTTDRELADALRIALTKWKGKR